MGSMVEHCSMNSNNWNGNGFGQTCIGLDGMAMVAPQIFLNITLSPAKMSFIVLKGIGISEYFI